MRGETVTQQIAEIDWDSVRGCNMRFDQLFNGILVPQPSLIPQRKAGAERTGTVVHRSADPYGIEGLLGNAGPLQPGVFRGTAASCR